MFNASKASKLACEEKIKEEKDSRKAKDKEIKLILKEIKKSANDGYKSLVVNSLYDTTIEKLEELSFCVEAWWFDNKTRKIISWENPIGE